MTYLVIVLLTIIIFQQVIFYFERVRLYRMLMDKSPDAPFISSSNVYTKVKNPIKEKMREYVSIE